MSLIKLSSTLRPPTIAMLSFALLAACITPLIAPQRTNALTGWDAGSIIDDAVFANKSTMSVDQIQQFLNSKVPACDTYGQQTSEYGGPDLNGDGRTTRAEYGQYYYGQSTFPCLRDYNAGGKSAAQLIYEAAQNYNINPQVLIVLLQKEQGLVTDTWPLNIQYRSATGYGCPDGAACDSQYYGIANQINWAARMYRAILNDSPTWNKKYYPSWATDPNTGTTGSRYVAYNENGSCGGSWINIQNRATQALYNYTPYQPNDATLNANMGQTVNCGAYGNIHFFQYFNSWFGSTHGGQPPIQDSVKLTQSLSITPNGSNDEKQSYTASFTLKNNSGSKIDVGWMLVSVRDSANFNLDFPIKYVSIEPQGTYTYTSSRTFQWTDNMHAFINGNLTQGIGWSTDYPQSNDNSILKSIDFRVGSDVVISSPGIQVRQTDNSNTFTATTTFVNRTASSRDIGWFMVSGRTPYGKNIDFPGQEVIIPANSTYIYTQSQQIDLTDMGDFSFFANLNDASPGGYGWTTTYPGNSNIWVSRSIVYRNGPNVIQNSPLSVSTDAVGGTVATVGFKNQGNQAEDLGWVIVSTRRNNDQSNYDFSPQRIILNPGESKNITFTQQLLRSGNYTSSLIFNRSDGWSTSYAPSAQSTVARSTTFSGGYAAGLASDLLLAVNGKEATGSLTLKNNSQSNLDLGWVIISVRDVNGNNYDFPGVKATLKPGEVKTFTTDRSFPTGSYTSTITTYHPLYGWGNTFDTANYNYQKNWIIN